MIARRALDLWLSAAAVSILAGCSTNTKPLDETTKTARAPQATRAAAASKERTGTGYGTGSAMGAAPASTPAGPAAILTGSGVTVQGLTFDPRPGWTQGPSGGMRAAQFTLPSHGGEAPELILFNFGAGQGGDAQSNLDRWIGQISQPDGGDSKARAKSATRSVGALKISTVVVDGTYTTTMGGPMSGGEKVSKPDQRLWGAVIEGEGGPWFWKATGPRDAMEALMPEFDAFLSSQRVGGNTAARSAPATAPAPGNGGSAVVAGLAFATPSDWSSTPPTSNMRAAQYALPAIGGEAPELVLFFFGEGKGGDTQSNLDRWIGQISQPDGKDSKARATIARRDVAGLKVSTVVVDGSYVTSPMMGATTTGTKPDQRLWGAVVEGPGGPWFWKAVGPRKVMEVLGPQFDTFVASMHTAQ